jgi:hypothetical protein
VRTVKRWLAEHPAFRLQVAALRRDLTERAAGVLAKGMIEAGVTLRRLLRSNSEAVRLKTAEALLAHGSGLNTLAVLQADVEELKRSTLPKRSR